MLKIWGRPTSICTQRALWGLDEAGLPYELTLASATMGPKGHVSKGVPAFGIVDTPEYRAMNPNGTVPTIDDGGVILWESNAILHWLALKHAPDALFGGDLATFARASAWMSWANEHLEPPLHTLVMELVRLAPAKRDAAKRDEANREILKPLALLDAHLAKQPYVAGDRFTMGDISTAAAVHRWFVFDQPRPAMRHLEAWHARLAQRPGFSRHVAPREHHIAG